MNAKQPMPSLPDNRLAEISAELSQFRRVIEQLPRVNQKGFAGLRELYALRRGFG